ncbi:hypothetical protein GXP67_30635 [Rhodocytophaga rosea]|uniref:Uncharacterized protein n=1 Tax=Rhodocytophaga rosea TaxID=2704465 RepID=A0A6C0GRK1_9BACT|nr:hypothetical protein [Rhodocytophaga rosea]QHT70696.1 hypothetical protein GXP67_30635 [Rhodocytophaga rosea]
MLASATITDILQTLLRHEKVSAWKTKCCYSDGAGNSLHEIDLFLNTGSREKILYHMESGNVIKCGNRPFSTQSPVDIVDFLLDLYNE